MGKSARELRVEIAHIRNELDDTLEELNDHVRPRRIYERKTRHMRDRLRSMRESVMGTTSNATDEVTSTVRDMPSKLEGQARGNPLAAGLIAFGIGAVLGSLVPSSEPEREAVGAMSDQIEPLRQKAMESAQQVKSDVGDAARDATDTVKEHAQGAVQDVRDQAQQPTMQQPTALPR